MADEQRPGSQIHIVDLDLDVAVKVYGARTVVVVAEGLDRKRLEMGLLLGEHRRYLTFGGAVDAGVGPALFPVIQMRLGQFDALEAFSLQSGVLGVPDAAFDLALAISVADSTWQRDHAVVRQHVAVQGIENGVVDVGGEHALFQIVEDNHPRTAAEASQGLLVQLSPDPSARSPHQQPHALAAVAQGHHE